MEISHKQSYNIKKMVHISVFQELMKTMAQTVSAGGNLLGHSIAMTSDFIDLIITISYC